MSRDAVSAPITTARNRLWLVALIVGLPAVVGYFFLPQDVANVAYEAFGAITTAAIVVGVMLHRPRHAPLWLLVAAGIGLWTAGDAVTALLVPDGGDVPTPSWADALYLSGYAVLIVAAGLLAGPLSRGSSMDHPAILDAAILATTAGFVIWLALVNPLLSVSDQPLDATLVNAAYPILDILLIAVVARHLLINGQIAVAAILLALGIACYLAADLLYVAESIYGTYSALDLLNAGWLAAYVLIAAGALHPSMRSIGDTDNEMRPLPTARVILLATSAVVPAIVIVLQDTPVLADRLVLGLGSMLLTGLVLARLLGALREQRLMHDRSHHEARHDRLTSLANRTLFEERLGEALEMSRPGVGLLYLDLDNFKNVNDTMGHRVGDSLLRIVADRLGLLVRAGDDVARLGGDEFAVIVGHAASVASAISVADRILDAFRPDVALGDVQLPLKASIGIVWVLRGELTPDEMLRRADVAMYDAKRARRGYAVYDPARDPAVQQEAARIARPASPAHPLGVSS